MSIVIAGTHELYLCSSEWWLCTTYVFKLICLSEITQYELQVLYHGHIVASLYLPWMKQRDMKYNTITCQVENLNIVFFFPKEEQNLQILKHPISLAGVRCGVLCYRTDSFRKLIQEKILFLLRIARFSVLATQEQFSTCCFMATKIQKTQ